MKKITSEEFSKLEFKTARGASNAILMRLRTLEIGEALVFSKEEWKPKSSPSALIAQAFRSERRLKGNAGKFTTKQLNDNSGWAALRIA